MNERIIKFSDEAWNIASEQHSIHSPLLLRTYTEKFAELIILDCKNVIRQEWFNENNTDPEQEGRSIAIHIGKKIGLDTALDVITDRFGVE